MTNPPIKLKILEIIKFLDVQRKWWLVKYHCEGTQSTVLASNIY